MGGSGQRKRELSSLPGRGHAARGAASLPEIPSYEPSLCTQICEYDRAKGVLGRGEKEAERQLAQRTPLLCYE